MITWKEVRKMAGMDASSGLYENIQTTFATVQRLIPRIETYLEKACRKRVGLMKPSLRTGPNGLQFKFACGRKKSGDLIAPQYILAVTYKPGADLYDVETSKIDGWANVVWREVFADVDNEFLAEPERYFRRARAEKNKPQIESTGQRVKREFVVIEETLQGGTVPIPREFSELRTEDVDAEFLHKAGLLARDNLFTEFVNAPYDMRAPVSDRVQEAFQQSRMLAGLEPAWRLTEAQVRTPRQGQAAPSASSPEDSPVVSELDETTVKNMLLAADAWRTLIRSGDNFLELIAALVQEAEAAQSQGHWRRTRHKVGGMRQVLTRLEALVKSMYGSFATGRDAWYSVLRAWQIPTRRQRGTGLPRRTPQDLGPVSGTQLVADLRSQSNDLMSAMQGLLDQGARVQRALRDGARTRMPDREAIVSGGLAFRDMVGAVLYGRVQGLVRRAAEFLRKAAEFEKYEDLDVDQAYEVAEGLDNFAAALDVFEDSLDELDETRKHFTTKQIRQVQRAARSVAGKAHARAATKQLRGKTTTSLSVSRLRKLSPAAQDRARSWAARMVHSKNAKLRKRAKRVLSALEAVDHSAEQSGMVAEGAGSAHAWQEELDRGIRRLSDGVEIRFDRKMGDKVVYSAHWGTGIAYEVVITLPRRTEAWEVRYSVVTDEDEMPHDVVHRGIGLAQLLKEIAQLPTTLKKLSASYHSM